MVLAVGPVALTAICYAVAAPQSENPIQSRRSLAWERSAKSELSAQEDSAAALSKSMVAERDRLSRLLPGPANFFEASEFLYAGDVSSRVLRQIHEEWVAPIRRSLEIDFFDHRPAGPVVVVVMSDDERYRAASLALEGAERQEYSGYYSRPARRVVVNLSTGSGTLTHELTHALAHADFPAMPEWFDEGLASLYEECEYSADGNQLRGQDNWRLQVLAEALRGDRLPTLDEMLLSTFGRSNDPAVEYAQARYLCLYLQDQGLLAAYYRKCREIDPVGRNTLARLFGLNDVAAVDAAFRNWLTERIENLPGQTSRQSGAPEVLRQADLMQRRSVPR